MMNRSVMLVEKCKYDTEKDRISVGHYKEVGLEVNRQLIVCSCLITRMDRNIKKLINALKVWWSSYIWE
jgi:hypothetical protein